MKSLLTAVMAGTLILGAGCAPVQPPAATGTIVSRTYIRDNGSDVQRFVALDQLRGTWILHLFNGAQVHVSAEIFQRCELADMYPDCANVIIG